MSDDVDAQIKAIALHAQLQELAVPYLPTDNQIITDAIAGIRSSETNRLTVPQMQFLQEYQRQTQVNQKPSKRRRMKKK
jgi:hypothetical protein